MKTILRFLRLTLVGGFLFLVPIVALVMILGKALALTHKVVHPLAAHIPVKSVFGFETPVLLAIFLLTLFCFLVGCFARTALARKAITALETSVLSNVPGYEFLKSVVGSLLGVEKQTGYQPILARIEDAWQIAFLVERIEDGTVVVFVPDAPNPHSGAIYFMTPDRIKVIDIPVGAALKCLRRLGAGSGALLRGVSMGETSAK